MIFSCTCLGREILQAVLLRSIEVAALVLRHPDAPGPGGGGGGRVDINGEGHTGGTGGDEHVLPGVVAADYWGRTMGERQSWNKSKVLVLNYKIF